MEFKSLAIFVRDDETDVMYQRSVWYKANRVGCIAHAYETWVEICGKQNVEVIGSTEIEGE